MSLFDAPINLQNERKRKNKYNAFSKKMAN